MKSISLSFQVHHPFKLKKYRFFDIGNDSYYYDDFENERNIRIAAEHFYLPTNEILIGLLRKYPGYFKIAFSLSGLAIDQFYLYAPEVIDSFQRMAEMEGVEFLCETYSHSLASLQSKSEFSKQVKAHAAKIEKFFDQSPCVFKNTELIYSDTIGEMVAEMGFKAVLTEGAKLILRWKSPNCLYKNPLNPELMILLRNNYLSQKISLLLANPDWAGSAKAYIAELNALTPGENIINLFLDYDQISSGQRKKAGIHNFLKTFPSSVLEMTEYRFMTPSEIVHQFPAISEIHIPDPISREDHKGEDLSAWLGNELQQEALSKLYSVKDKIENCTNKDLIKDWEYLQSTDHFYFMSSKFFYNFYKREEFSLSNPYNNPYNNPYEAFMNYMNILNDFSVRLDKSVEKINRVFMYAKSKETVKAKSI